MKNYEKYADEIREYKGKDFCKDIVQTHILKEISCSDIRCGRCHTLQLLWMLEEYKEPEEPKVDWSKVKVNTPILVRDYESQEWARKYFAKYENETIYAWDSGRTSWTGDGVTEWRYAKLAESEDE